MLQWGQWLAEPTVIAFGSIALLALYGATHSIVANIILQLSNLVWFFLIPFVMIQMCAH